MLLNYMEVKEIKVSDDLKKLMLDINSASWEEGNDTEMLFSIEFRCVFREAALFVFSMLPRT